MVFEPYTIMVMIGASLFGLFVGAVPGLTATMATALLVPVTFFMAPIPAIAAMVTASGLPLASGLRAVAEEARAFVGQVDVALCLPATLIHRAAEAVPGFPIGAHSTAPIELR